jgi:hypothetical protein
MADPEIHRVRLGSARRRAIPGGSVTGSGWNHCQPDDNMRRVIHIRFAPRLQIFGFSRAVTLRCLVSFGLLGKPE